MVVGKAGPSNDYRPARRVARIARRCYLEDMTTLAEISVQSRQRAEFIKLDAQVAKAIEESGVRDGVCVVYVPHTTAGVIINEGADPDVVSDALARLAHIVPRDAGYAHREGNADSHIKAMLVGASATVLVKDGKALLGTWQSIFFCEFDGPRHRRVLVKVVKG
jgi:secondary thiamine-phosphate synthase enzyme